jgi:predicted PurR-regulated permease PerM
MNKKASFVSYPINLILIALFVVCIVTFAIGLGNLYGISSSDMIDKKINVTIFEKSITDSNANIQSSYNLTNQDELNTNQNVLSLKSMWGTIKNTGSIISSMFNVLSSLIVNVMHVPSIVFYSFLAIFTIGLIFAIIKLIFTGD